MGRGEHVEREKRKATEALGEGHDLWGGMWGVAGEMHGESKTKKGGRKKRKATHALITELVLVAQTFTNNAYAASSVKSVKTALRAFGEFDEVYRHSRPIMLMQPRYYGDMEASLHNEMTLCLFAAWLHEHGLAPNTVTTYTSLCKTNLGVGLGWALTVKDMEMRLPRMLKGIRRMHKRIRKKRLGWRARYERQLREATGPPRGLDALMQAAVRCGLRQGLLRGADVVPDDGKFDPTRHATLDDIEFVEYPRKHIKWLVQPAKKSEQQGKTEYVFLPEGDGVSDAYTAFVAMLEARQAKRGQEPGDAPLFVFSHGGPWRVRHVRSLFQQSAAVLGITHGGLGAQSGRIGGATDLWATNCSPAVLQVNGRWARAERPNPGPSYLTDLPTYHTREP